MTRKSSFPPITRADARLLVLGSLPGERSLEQGRYYAHPQNQFWALMSAVVGADLPALAYPDRLAALVAARVALWDVIGSANRRGSTDAAIRDAEANDLSALVVKLPGLRAVAFNGSTAAAIGRRALAGSRLTLVPLPSSSPLHTVGLTVKQPAWSALRTYLAD